MRIERFKDYCQVWLKSGRPFVAWYHFHGYGMMYTRDLQWTDFIVYFGPNGRAGGRGGKRVTHTAEQRDALIASLRARSMPILRVEEKLREKPVSAGKLRALEKMLKRLRKDQPSLRVVRFDGVTPALEGDDLDDLQTLFVSANGD